MNVKKYRATTTREALEQVKQDLGENAFVLETKQVRAGGFLGFKSGTQIEISAALPEFSDKPLAAKPARSSVHSNSILNLTDDTVAAPTAADRNEIEKNNILNALNSRVAMTEKFETAIAPQTSRLNRSTEIEAVEISTEAPRFVHQRRERPVQMLADQPLPVMEPIITMEPAPVAIPVTVAAPVAEAASTVTISSSDFELLRAELREVKFSLNAFTARQNAPVWDENVSFEAFGEVFEAPFYDAYVDLTSTGISPDAARQMISKVIPFYKKGFVQAEQISRHALIQALSSQLKFESNLLEAGKPSVIAMIGSTGVGKTTTIAKLAARVALHEQRPVELVTLDTYRIAAVEQLKTYAEIIGAGCQVVRSVLELDAVLRRMSPETTVLIDTTGKNPHDLADQYEFSEYLRHNNEIRKCLAVQSTIHPLDGIAAIKKFQMYGADCLALTKIDETTRPGAMLEMVGESGLPLAYVCTGQRVPEDLQIATPDSLTNYILG